MSSQAEWFVALCTFMRLLSDVSEEMCGQFPGRYDGLDTKGANVFVGHVQNINTAILRLFTITEKVTADILRYLATFPFPPYTKNNRFLVQPELEPGKWQNSLKSYNFLGKL